MALTPISNIITFLDKCKRNVNELVQNSSMVAVNECLIELSNFNIPENFAAIEADIATIDKYLGNAVNVVTGISSAGEIDFANGSLAYAVIDNSVTETTIDLLFPSAGVYTLLLRQGDTDATVLFTATGGILWQDGTPPTLSLAGEGDQLRFTVINDTGGSLLITGVHELSGIVF